MRPAASPRTEWPDFTAADRNWGKSLRKTLIIAAAVIALLLEGYFACALPDQATAEIEMEALH
jgi:hypothetical protein